MSGHRLFRYLAVVSAAAGLACGDYTGPTSPSQQKQVSSTSSVDASFSRYILISGVLVCVEGCEEGGKEEGGN
jgi:hypothetical protein